MRRARGQFNRKILFDHRQARSFDREPDGGLRRLLRVVNFKANTEIAMITGAFAVR